MKLIVTGHARHGKDTVCEILSKHYEQIKFVSSSEFACEKVVFPVLKDIYNYKTKEECFLDRFNHRKEWFDLIRNYNTPDLTRLGREIFKENTIYCGLRNIEEFKALKKAKVFDASIWVDASDRVSLENSNSISITKNDCDYIIFNNGTLEDLKRNIKIMLEI